MSEEKFDAKVDKVSGSVKESVGKLTGDKEVESEGKVDKLKGHAKEKLADIKDTIKGAPEEIAALALPACSEAKFPVACAASVDGLLYCH